VYMSFVSNVHILVFSLIEMLFRPFISSTEFFTLYVYRRFNVSFRIL
jgi:hypothetical protein